MCVHFLSIRTELIPLHRHICTQRWHWVVCCHMHPKYISLPGAEFYLPLGSCYRSRADHSRSSGSDRAVDRLLKKLDVLFTRFHRCAISLHRLLSRLLNVPVSSRITLRLAGTIVSHQQANTSILKTLG